MNKKLLAILLLLLMCTLTSVSYLFIPPLKTRVDGRLNQWVTDFRYWLNPPEEVVFVPQTAVLPTAQPVILQATSTIEPTLLPTYTPPPTLTPPTAVDQPPPPTQTPPPPTATPFVIPASALIEGVEFQTQIGYWNYCAPANLAMALSYWGTPFKREDVGYFVRGSAARVDDKNVAPFEMAHFVETQTELAVTVRSGGDLSVVKRLVTAGFPVVIEKGYVLESEGWMGHYLLINGFDDNTAEFIAQDSYKGADTRVSYEATTAAWRAFNNTFLVVYPPEQALAVAAALEEWQDVNWSREQALAIAQTEAQTLTGRDQFFAQFNVGTSLMELQRYDEAAAAFDQAFALYAELPANLRPWRMMWYQTSPYEAYYHAGRYQDVINLATTTLDIMNEPILEEDYYWRGMAHLALNNQSAGRTDLETAVRLNPNFYPAVEALESLP